MMAKTKVLILGGTGKARELARQAIPMFDSTAEFISSQAGVTQDPIAIPGRMVTGGFGGIAGLAEFMGHEQIQILIDATHPFAEAMSDNAYVACTTSKVKRITLGRDAWDLPAGGRWIEVVNMEAAAEEISNSAKRVFITTGQRGLDAFSNLSDIWFLVRMIDMPETALNLASHQIITGRPPFDLDAERALLKTHMIDVLVSKNSGGAATLPKITAALEAEIPIVLLRSPAKLPGLWTSSVDDCLQWLAENI
jgi:precorrin-6A/cobalt-precorrin-6A reductase